MTEAIPSPQSVMIIAVFFPPGFMFPTTAVERTARCYRNVSDRTVSEFLSAVLIVQPRGSELGLIEVAHKRQHIPNHFSLILRELTDFKSGNLLLFSYRVTGASNGTAWTVEEAALIG